jgi:predicted membrane protein
VETFADIVGNLGVICFLAAYFLLQKGRIPHTSLLYLGLNLAGSILLLISLMIEWNLSAFVLEAAWALISIYGIIKQRPRNLKARDDGQ